MVILARTSTGLLYQSDGSLSGWSGAAEWTSVSTIRFVASPSIPIAPGAIASIPKGEPKLTAVGNNWFLGYDNLLIGGQAFPGIQVSADRGITWTDLGPLRFSSALPGGGLSGSHHYLDPISGNWYYHAVGGVGVTAGGGLETPYTYYIYASSGDITGPYALSATMAAIANTWAHSNPGPGGCYWDGTHYQLYGSGNFSSGTGVIGLWEGASLSGTFTQVAPTTAVFDVTTNGPVQTDVFAVEGASLAYNSVLNIYILTVNTDINQSSNTYSWSTMIQTATAPPSFSTSGWKTTQWVNAADALSILDITQFMHDGSNSRAAVGPNGEMVAICSGQRSPGGFTPNYSRLQPSVSVYEPATAVIRYAGLDALYRQLTRTLSHSDFVAECGCELTGISGGAGEFHIVYRSDGSGNNEYRAILGTDTQWRLDKIAGGTRSLLTTGSGTQTFANQGATLGFIHRFKVQVIGNVHSAWLDGELQYAFTDSSSPFTSGNTIAVAGVNLACDTINLSCRTGDTITVNGMQPLTSCWLRAAFGIPIASIAANSSGVGTISYGHFPLFSLDIAGTDYTVGADSRIWGGDTLQFSGLPSSPPAVPNFVHFA